MDQREATQAVLDWAAIFMRLSMHDFTRHARGAGLSLAHMLALTHLHHRGPCEVMSFGDLMQVSPAGASQMVERLVQQGLVQRNETPDDRRVRLVHLTEAGQQVVAESIQARQGWVEGLLAALTDEQRSAVGGVLRMLTEQAVAWEAQSDAPRA